MGQPRNSQPPTSGEPQNERSNSATPQTTETLSPPVGVVRGAIFGLTAAALYTAANIALRQSISIDAILVSAVKAIPTVAFLAPTLAWMCLRGKVIATNYDLLPKFAFASLGAQFIGNVAFQKSLEVVGLATAVTITLGVLIIGGALFGRLILGEPVRMRVAASMLTLIAAVFVLNIQIGDVAELSTPSKVPFWVGGLYAVASGLAYSLFGVVTRQALIGGLTPQLAMFVSGSVGMMSLWLATLLTLGVAPLADVSFNQWQVMLAAGLFNFLAFVALTVSLKALPVVAVNLLNATQVAMAAVAGVVLFAEPITTQLVLGIVLTFAGLAILAGKKKAQPSFTTLDE